MERALGPLGLLLLLLPLVLAAPHLEALDNNDVDEDVAARGNGFLDFSRGYQRLGKKMILPLLVGILLKVASFVPLILGKLSLLALASIVASKLALLISAIIGTKKLSQVAMPYSYSHHGADWDGAASTMYAEMAHPGAAAAAAAYGAAYGAHPSAMPHRRAGPHAGPHGGRTQPPARSPHSQRSSAAVSTRKVYRRLQATAKGTGANSAQSPTSRRQPSPTPPTASSAPTSSSGEGGKTLQERRERRQRRSTRA